MQNQELTATASRIASPQVPATALEAILELMDQGLFLQAYAKAQQFGPLQQWTKTEARLVAARLVGHLGAPRLRYTLYLLAWRQAKQSPDALYRYVNTLMARQGLWQAWQVLLQYPQLPHASDQQQADWLSLEASIWGQWRDFERANAKLNEALVLAPADPWLQLRRAWLLEAEDRYPEALAHAQAILKENPSHYGAINYVAHLLTLVNRDRDALVLLESAVQRLESAQLVQQLALLQQEMGAYESAQCSYQRWGELTPLREPKADAWLHASLAEVAYLLGKDQQAVHYVQPLLALQDYRAFAQAISGLPCAGQRIVLPVNFVRQHHMTCAPATLTALSCYWGRPIGHLDLVERICYNGTRSFQEREWATDQGWWVKEFTVTWEICQQLIDLGIPFTLSTVAANSAHLQAVVGYDSRLHLILVRDPYERHLVEFNAQPLLTQQRAFGPRGMVMVPPEKAAELTAVVLPDVQMYDQLYALQQALQIHDRSQAVWHYEQMLATAPEHRLCSEALMEVAGYDNNTTQWLESLEQLLSQFPDDERLLQRKISGWVGLVPRAAQLDLLAAVSQKPDCHPIFWQQYAHLLQEDARTFPVAIRLLKRAIRVVPSEAENYHELASIYWSQRWFAQALELYRIAASIEDKSQGYARSYFMAAQFVGQAETVITFLEHRWQRDRKRSCLPAYTLAWAYERLERVPDMFALLDAAQAEHPQDGDLLLYRAKLLGRYGQKEAAQTLLTQARGHCSEAAWLCAAAEMAQIRCDRKQALALWQQALALDPLSTKATQAIAKLLAETEGNPAAQTFLQQRCQTFPHHYTLHQLWHQWLEDDQPEAAIQVLRHMVNINPADAWTRRQLVWHMTDQQDWATAWSELNLAGELEPHSASYYNAYAYLCAAENRISEAQTALQKSIDLDVDSEWAISQLLSLSQSSTDKRQALAFIYNALVEQVNQGDGLLLYARIAQPLLAPEELKIQLQTALTARPDLWHAWVALVQQLTYMGQLTEAEQLAQQATTRFPLLPRIWIELAQVHQAEGDTAAEISALEQALTINPGWCQALRQLALAYERTGKLEQSQSLLERAIHHDPLDALNHGYLADSLWKLNHQAQALDCLQQALQLEPGYSWAWEKMQDWATTLQQPQLAPTLARNLTRERAGEARPWIVLAEQLTGEENQSERLAALERALTLNPRCLDAHDLKADILAEAGKFDEAIAACHAPVWQGKTPYRLQARAAWVEAQRNNLTLAIEQMKQVAAQEPGYATAWYHLAQWYQQTAAVADYVEAAQHYARLNAKDCAAWGLLGDALQAQGNRSEAKAAFRTALELEPSYQFAGLWLFDLEFEDRGFAAAEQALAMMRPHLENQWVWARSVQLAAQQADLPRAEADFQQLCQTPTEEEWPLETATTAILDAGWADVFESLLLGYVLERTDLHPEVGGAWVRYCLKLGQEQACQERMLSFTTTHPLQRQAMITYLNILLQQKDKRRWCRFVEANQTQLRRHDQTWGKVGYGWLYWGNYQRVIGWSADWQQRTQAEPWMLLNLTLALRLRHQSALARRVNRHALTRRSEEDCAAHRIWLAWDAALAQRANKALDYLTVVNVSQQNEGYQFLYKLTEAILAAQAQQMPRHRRLQAAQVLIADAIAIRPQFWARITWRQTFRQTVWWIAKHNLGWTTPLWAYWQCCQSSLTASDADDMSIEKLTMIFIFVAGACCLAIIKASS